MLYEVVTRDMWDHEKVMFVGCKEEAEVCAHQVRAEIRNNRYQGVEVLLREV